MKWTIYVCPRCHQIGMEGNCPLGCVEGPEYKSVRCVAVEVIPTNLGSIALINAFLGLEQAPPP